jgi:thioredoxin reductase (NADPH)
MGLDWVGSGLVYALLLGGIWGVYGLYRRRRTRRSLERLEASRGAGLMEPASLHPLIDPALCLGCGSCAPACPEGNVIGLVDGKAELVAPANCIGHGACREACPLGAITLVFGTETRGVDIPMLSEDFETNVPGLFVAGELGGMGLIRNAIEQGRQAIESVACLDGIGEGEGLDVVIVGAGPAGFAASLAAQERGLRFVTLEQETLGGAVAHYPRGKIVMTAPVHLPLYGKLKLREASKEALLSLWQDVQRRTGLELRTEERVEGIERLGRGFEVKSSRGSYRTRAVVLAVGRRGTPRKLGAPGEERDKVVYRLIDPERYAGSRVLVVGGGDSALEAATALAAVSGTEVTLSYRGEAFSRAKPVNRERVARAEAAGRLRVRLGSQVAGIEADAVRLSALAGEERLPNDAVVVCAGGILPTGFLRSIGVEVETKHGTA